MAHAADVAYTAAQVSGNMYGPGQQLSQQAQNQRASLLLVGGYANGCTTGCTLYESVIVALGNGTKDAETPAAFQGWVFAFNSNPNDALYLTASYTQNNSGGVANALPYITQCEFPPTSGATYTPTCTTPAQQNAQLPNPCGQGGGVWMGSRGPSANAYGQVYYTAGNGGFSYCPNCGVNYCAGQPPSGNSVQRFTNFGESVLRTDMTQLWGSGATATGPVQAQFWPVDYFVPYKLPTGIANPYNCDPNGNSACSYFQVMNQGNLDMGVSGTLLFDDDYYNDTGMNLTPTCLAGQVCHNTSMLMSANKRGDGYVLRQYDLGQYTYNDQGVMTQYGLDRGMVSYFQISSPASPYSTDEPRTPAYWRPTGAENGFLVIWPWNETLASFKWTQQGGADPQFSFGMPISMATNPFAGITLGQPPASSTTGYAGGALMLTVNPNPPDSSGVAIVWAVAEPYPNLFPPYPPGPCIQTNGVFCLGYLFAYELDGTGALTQIWPKTLPTNATVPDFASTPFATPTAAHGHVYVPTFGLCSQFNGSNCATGNLYTNAGVQAYGL